MAPFPLTHNDISLYTFYLTVVIFIIFISPDKIISSGEKTMKKPYQERIISHPDLRGGEPCIKGTRIPVSIIVGSLAQGMTREEILGEYPQLTNEDISAALMYASESVQQESVYA